MKLYYATGSCSLSPHIVALEAGVPLQIERVNLRVSPHVTESGADYSAVNPNGYVPALRLDDDTVLTEGPVIAVYLAEQRPDSGLLPPAGTVERAQLQSWLNFISTEIHKTFGPWLFSPEIGEPAQAFARKTLARRLAWVDSQLAAGGPYLMGERFTPADAYLYTVLGWAGVTGVDLSGFAALGAFLERVGARPAVQQAQQAQGLKPKA